MKSYSSREAIKILRKDGWELERINGDHHIFVHPTKPNSVPVPHPKKDLPIGTFKNIMRLAQITLK